MRFLPQIAALSIACVALAADPMTPEKQIERLGDADPVVREEASAALKAMGTDARPALVKAAKSGRLGVADEAATLLLSLPWYQEDDPQQIRMLLRSYGKLPASERGKIIAGVASAKVNDAVLERAPAIALRVMLEEPSERTLWSAAALLSGNTAFEELARKLPPPLPPAVQYVVLKKRLSTHPLQPLNDEARSTLAAVLDSLFKAEIFDQTAVLQSLTEHQISDAQRRGDWRTELAATRRWTPLAQTLQGEFPMRRRDVESLPDRIPTLHVARPQPLPGMVDDLVSANDANPGVLSSMAIATVAQRNGFSGAASMLKSAALKPLEDEEPAAKAMMMVQLSGWYSDVGEVEQSEKALLAIENMNLPANDLALFTSRLQLYNRYLAEERDEGAIWVLQKLSTDHPDGQPPVKDLNEWTPRQMADEIAWRRWRMTRDKQPASEKQLADILTTAAEDSTVAMDVIPWLDSQNRKKEADAIFDQHYAELTKKDENPQALAELLRPNTNNEFAWFCSRSGRKIDEAVKAAEAAVASRPTEAAYLDTLAEAKFRAGDYDTAIAMEKLALVERPRDPFMTAQLERFEKARAEKNR